MWLDEDIETVGILRSMAIAGVKLLKFIIRVRVGIKNIIFPKTRHSYLFNGCYPRLVAAQLEILHEINTTLKYIPYFLDQMPWLLYFLLLTFHRLLFWGRRLFLLEARRHQWWLNKVRTSDTTTTVRRCQYFVWLLSPGVSSGNESYNMNRPTASQPGDHHHLYRCVCVPVHLTWLLFKGGVYFAQSLRMCSCYLRAASVQSNTVSLSGGCIPLWWVHPSLVGAWFQSLIGIKCTD